MTACRCAGSSGWSFAATFLFLMTSLEESMMSNTGDMSSPANKSHHWLCNLTTLLMFGSDSIKPGPIILSETRMIVLPLSQMAATQTVIYRLGSRLNFGWGMWHGFGALIIA